ncbi:hypothetical protein Ato02nite_074980 [Paractinoplanes toevensis]|uniref:Uncharacterized protein n=1 Tax=Paractinoplanes toevensis TaxID=571911 RepID=A0A919W724_9ACTN|nr:hypothetical protein Ato02nite_074980 [Actinoplanes toevensis]
MCARRSDWAVWHHERPARQHPTTLDNFPAATRPGIVKQVISADGRAGNAEGAVSRRTSIAGGRTGCGIGNRGADHLAPRPGRTPVPGGN